MNMFIIQCHTTTETKFLLAMIMMGVRGVYALTSKEGGSGMAQNYGHWNKNSTKRR